MKKFSRLTWIGFLMVAAALAGCGQETKRERTSGPPPGRENFTPDQIPEETPNAKGGMTKTFPQRPPTRAKGR
jgi:hypothetical protein